MRSENGEIDRNPPPRGRGRLRTHNQISHPLSKPQPSSRACRSTAATGKRPAPLWAKLALASVAALLAVAGALIALGNVCLQRRQFDQARDCYLRALKTNPDHVVALTNLAGTCLAQGDRPPAIRYLRRAIELEPGHFTAHNNLAYALELEGDRAGAIAEYRRALELQPDHPTPQKALQRLGAAGSP